MPQHVLDIGGGVAVMDVPIMKHYDPVPKLAVLDGVWWEVGDKIKHDIPFNSPKATNELLEANGLRLETLSPLLLLVLGRNVLLFLNHSI
jgi:hypothetical protein